MLGLRLVFVPHVAFLLTSLRGPALYGYLPVQIAPYFAKVECFCFEEQQILAGEEVDLPVFFFIDRDVLESVQHASACPRPGS